MSDCTIAIDKVNHNRELHVRCINGHEGERVQRHRDFMLKLEEQYRYREHETMKYTITEPKRGRETQPDSF